MRGITRTVIAAGLCLTICGAANALERPAASREELAAGSAHTITVRCDRRETITEALRHPASKLIIRLQGVCQENVVIDRDDVSLVGDGAGAAVVGSVVVASAIRIELHGFTVRETVGIESSGIGVFHGASAKIVDMKVENTEGRGIQILTAAAQIENVQVSGAGNVGLLVRGSLVNFEGDIVCTGNGLAGISITLSSSVFSKAANLRVAGNPIGLIIQENSAFEIPGGSIVASGNQRSGIELQSQGLLNYGASIEANNNRLFGMRLDEQSSASPFAGFQPVVSVSNNGFTGVFVERGSTVELTGATTVQGNRVFGIFVEESAFRIDGATITGNGVRDIRLIFGSKASFEGAAATVGTMDCDATVLIRGRTCTPMR